MVRERKCISDFATTSSGGTPSRDRLEYFKGNIRWVTTSELRDSYIEDTNEHISNEAIANSAAKVFPANTLLMAMYGATIGRLGIITNEAATNQACCAIFPDSTVDTKYLFYCLLYDRKNIVDKGCGAGQPNISQDIIKNIEVPYCDIDEQKAIASALSDVDELIANLEKLIEKKKAIKQGVMQELLTGKKRLPGFNGEWKEHTIGNILKIGHGKDYKNLSNGDVPVYGTGGLMTYVNDYLYDGKTVCIGRKGTIDAPQYHEGKIWTVDTLFYTHSFQNAIPKFVYYKFLLVDWRSHNEASGVPSLTAKKIESLELSMPEMDEQKAICNVLSDMDGEINRLEEKLDKYRMVKQGMMQKLLTGEIRLV